MGVENSEKINQEASSSCGVAYWIAPTELKLHHNYILWYDNFAGLVVTSFIPGGLLTFFNWYIYKLLNQSNLKMAPVPLENEIRNQTENRIDNRRTFILFSIIGMFIFCHSLNGILHIHEAYIAFINVHQKCTLRYLKLLTFSISESLIQINASVIFFHLLFFDFEFRNFLISKCLRRELNNEKMRRTFDELDRNIRRTLQAIEIEEIGENISL